MQLAYFCKAWCTIKNTLLLPHKHMLPPLSQALKVYLLSYSFNLTFIKEQMRELNKMEMKANKKYIYCVKQVYLTKLQESFILITLC